MIINSAYILVIGLINLKKKKIMWFPHKEPYIFLVI